jgi:hypothetical protein
MSIFQGGLFEDIAEGLRNAKVMVACISDEVSEFFHSSVQ